MHRFLLAQLYMESLEKMHNLKSIREALLKLPKSLAGIYELNMIRIMEQNEEDRRLGLRVLSWIVHAVRPLKIIELQHAFALCPGDVQFDEEGITEQEILISVCAGLVTLDTQSGVIRLVHYTVQEYFDGSCRNRWFPSAEVDVAETCIASLALEIPSPEIYQMKFRAYAIHNVNKHLWAVDDGRRNAVTKLLCSS